MNKKRVAHVILGVTAAIIAMFLILSLSLSDKHINGLTGTFGIIKLTFSNEKGIKLTDEPVQYIVRGGNEDTWHLTQFLKDFTDNYKIATYYSGRATIDEVSYNYECRSFTNMYWIVTFTVI